jgi:hypothetical protein
MILTVRFSLARLGVCTPAKTHFCALVLGPFTSLLRRDVFSELCKVFGRKINSACYFVGLGVFFFGGAY